MNVIFLATSKEELDNLFGNNLEHVIIMSKKYFDELKNKLPANIEIDKSNITSIANHKLFLRSEG